MQTISKRAIAQFSLVLLVSSSLYSQYLSLPRSLKSKAVYYVRTKQLDRFSCGYNALFNAANFEQHCGFDNDTHRYPVFERRCMPYINSQGLNPKKTSYNKHTEYLAQNALKLQPFYHLRIDERRGAIAPILTGETRISYRSDTSKRDIKRKMRKAASRRRDRVIENIKRRLEDFSGYPVVVHFLCYVNSAKGGRHAVLVSLYQNHTGRGLYLFDNLNERVSESSDITQFLKYLSRTFHVSSKETFDGYELPHRWPHLDRQERGYKNRHQRGGRSR